MEAQSKQSIDSTDFLKPPVHRVWPVPAGFHRFENIAHPLSNSNRWLLVGKYNIGQLLYGHPLIIFIILPLGCPSRICLIKTLLEKNPMGKKFEWRKKSTTSFCMIICLVKNLTRTGDFWWASIILANCYMDIHL